MLDAFDFTIFFLIMVPISQEFGVPLTLVAGTVTFTLWLRLVGAFGSGWLCDRIGRKTPLMISILWYSICNFAAGFAPSFAVLAFFRILLGIGMGAEWPAGAALAMESWPARSRGIMSGLLQGAWGLGFLLATLSTACFLPASAGVACCGSASCRRCCACSFAPTFGNRRFGRRTTASGSSKSCWPRRRQRPGGGRSPAR